MGSKDVYQPTPPPAPSSGDAIRAYTQELPKLFALQQEFAPQEAQQQLNLLRQFGAPLGQAMRDAQRAVNPELTNLQDELARQSLAYSQEGLSDAEKNLYLDTFKSLAGNQVNSGIGADYVSKNLLGAQQQRQDYFRNLGLSLSGAQPVSQPGMPNFTNFTSSISPGDFLNYNSNIYGNQLAFSRPFVNMRSGYENAGTIMGGIGGLLTGAGSLRKPPGV